MSTMTSQHTIIWVSADRQGSIDMSGTYEADSRHDAVEAACHELLAQCGDDDERMGILAGTIDDIPVHGWTDIAD